MVTLLCNHMLVRMWRWWFPPQTSAMPGFYLYKLKLNKCVRVMPRFWNGKHRQDSGPERQRLRKVGTNVCRVKSMKV